MEVGGCRSGLPQRVWNLFHEELLALSDRTPVVEQQRRLETTQCKGTIT